jgi:phage shock protein E
MSNSSLDPGADRAPLLLDVRSAIEFASGHIEGAIHLPLDQLQQGARHLLPDPTHPLIVYCASGARSAFACAVLSQMGYLRAMNGGGMTLLAMSLERPVRTG